MALKPVCELFALFVKIHIVAFAGAEIFDLAALSFKFLSTGNQGVLKTLSVGILELLSQLFRLWKEFHGQAAAAQRRTARPSLPGAEPRASRPERISEAGV